MPLEIAPERANFCSVKKASKILKPFYPSCVIGGEWTVCTIFCVWNFYFLKMGTYVNIGVSNGTVGR